jgi:adenylylsulfate kinase-like enzyme
VPAVQTWGVIIVITGPIASGKSTVAQALAADLVRAGVRVSVIDLDVVHAELIAGATEAGDEAWAEARRRTAMMADALASDGIDVVIAEGSFNLPSDRNAFDQNLVDGGRPVYVTLEVSFDEALRRAKGDPTRDRSRDAEFLAAHFEARRAVLATVPATDIVIDTERTTASIAATTITDLVRAARDLGD